MLGSSIVLFMSDLSEGFARRLHEVCDEMGIPKHGKNRQGVLAKRFVVSQTAARKWLTGTGWPTMENLIDICDWAQIHLDWLCRGKGEKYLPSNAATDDRIAYVLRAMQESPSYKVDEIKSIVQIIVMAKSTGQNP